MHLIASSIPGRIRVRHSALRDPQALAALEKTVSRWRHVEAVSANARTGSLLIRYDAHALDEARCHARLTTTTARILGERLPASSARQAATAPAKRRSKLRVRANRLSKRAMLASLAASIALGAARQKRLHILTGWTFVGALAVHLWVYRRHILR